ncbi:hypothetical protein Dimus_025767 [Dionaea muscipula]
MEGNPRQASTVSSLPLVVRQEETVQPPPAPPPEDGPSGGSKWLAVVLPKKSTIIGALSVFAFIVSLPILGAVIWLIYMGDYDCEQLVKLPKLRVGITVCLALVFIISNLAAFFRLKFPVPGFIVVMVLLITMFLVGLAIVGGYKLQSHAIVGSPMWLRMKVNQNDNWILIKSCIFHNRVCDDLITRSFRLKPYEFITSNLSPMESGCCEPPSICGMEYVNATFWEKGSENEAPYDNKDCEAWENDRTGLCFNCQTCRDGFVDVIYGKWWKLGVFLIAMSIMLIASHLLLFLSTLLDRYGAGDRA